MLSLRWMFKNAKYKYQNLYNKKKLALFPYFYNEEGTRPWSFVGEGKGAVMLFLYILREPS